MLEKDKNLLYTIEVQYLQDNKWQMIKSFDDFVQLDKRISGIIPNTPSLPYKGLFAASGDLLYKQKLDLEKYLNVCVIDSLEFYL